MKGEIAVTRRATYKAEESITQLEGGKRLQDEMIDKLNEQLKRSQEELALNEAQLMAQRGEAGAADQTLRDAWQVRGRGRGTGYGVGVGVGTRRCATRGR